MNFLWSFSIQREPTKNRKRKCLQGQEGNVFEMTESSFRVDIKKKLFTVRKARHWNRLPRVLAYEPQLKFFCCCNGLSFYYLCYNGETGHKVAPAAYLEHPM